MILIAIIAHSSSTSIQFDFQLSIPIELYHFDVVAFLSSDYHILKILFDLPCVFSVLFELHLKVRRFEIWDSCFLEPGFLSLDEADHAAIDLILASFVLLCCIFVWTFVPFLGLSALFPNWLNCDQARSEFLIEVLWFLSSILSTLW